MNYYSLKEMEDLKSLIIIENNNLKAEIEEIKDNLRRSSGYDSDDGLYRDEATIIDIIKELKSDIIIELKTHVENAKEDTISDLKNTMNNIQERLISLEQSIQEIDNMIRYGPGSAVALAAKSDFETHAKII
jgi:chaperonin cofactor prefoldin